MHQPSVLATLTAVLAAVPAAQASLYTKSSPVLQLDSKTFARHIEKSNYTSIVEFYAPWCGHCKNLKPAYEKAAKNLEGLAKVAAVDCDDESNKALCAAQGVTGFPTIKTFRPGKKAGKPVVEDYNGPRTATAITEGVVNKINNHVTKFGDKEADDFLGSKGAKAILFTDKGTTSGLIRSIAIDFLDVISVGQVRNKEKATVERFGIQNFPTLVLIPEGGEPVTYEGGLNKKDMISFLSQVGEPNPDPAPAKGKSDKKSKTKEQKPKEPEPEEVPEPSTAEVIVEKAAPTTIPINTITSYSMLAEQCLLPKSHTCLLVNVPSGDSENGLKAVEAVTQLNTRFIQSGSKMFPFFVLPADIEGASSLRSTLELKEDVELIAINARRKWWRQYQGDFGVDSVSAWIDGIRLDESGKKKLPAEVIVEKVEQSSSTEATQATDPEPEVETGATEEEIVHGEL